MCNSHKHNRVCMVGLCAIEHCVLVHSVMGGFGLAGFLRHYWEGSVVDCLHAVGYCLGCRADYFKLSLVDCWAKVGWDGFVVRTLVPTERVEQGGA